MKQAEASGRSVEEAVEHALMELGATAEDVSIEVLDAGARGMLGIGARAARVRVVLKESAAAAAHHMAERMMRTMGFQASVRARERDDEITVEVRGQDMGALIGRRGMTLESVELLLGLMVTRTAGTRCRVTVDVEGYWERRRQWLEKLARQTAERAQREGRQIMLAPMPSRERRVIHTILADHPQVTTFSSGEGPQRRVIVSPRPQRPAEPDAGDAGDV